MEPFDDPVLGHLLWDAEFSVWEGEFVTPSGASVEIWVECDRDAVPPVVRESFTWLAGNEQSLRNQLAEQMLENANAWRNSGEAEITAESFAERVTLDNARLNDDGTVRLTYLDDDMFGSHGIIAELDAMRVMDDPYLVG